MDAVEDVYVDEGACPNCGSIELIKRGEPIRDQGGHGTITYPYTCDVCGTLGEETYHLVHLYNKKVSI